MNRDPQEWRPSTGLGAVALALFVTACVGLSDQGVGVYRTREWYATLFAVIAFGALAFVHLTALFLRGGFGVWERVLQLAELHQKLAPPAPQEPPTTQPEEPEPTADTSAEWRAAADRFVVAGDLHGFQVRKIAAGEHKVIEWEEWHILADFLIEAGILIRDGGTRWADDWNWRAWVAERETLPLPFRKGLPPRVEVTPNATRLQREKQAQQGAREAEGIGRVTE